MFQTIYKNIINRLSSLKLTIFLLLLIAFTSIFGTVIPQNKPDPFYAEHYSGTALELIRFFQLDNMYQSWWFYLLMGLFSVNLICCTLKRLSHIRAIFSPGPSHVTRAALDRKPLMRKFTVKKLGPETESRLKKIVADRFSAPVDCDVPDTQISFYSEKGKYGGLGFFCAHAGVLLILIGGVLGNLGFKGFMNLAEGETSNVVFLQGSSQTKKLDFSIRCNEFQLHYYENSQMPKDYKSSLTVIENGKEVLTKMIEVNDPLIYRGVYVYQSSYGTASDSGSAVIEMQPADRSASKERYALRMGERAELQKSGYEVEVLRLVPDFTIAPGGTVMSKSREPKNPAVLVGLFKNDELIHKQWSFVYFPDFHASQDALYTINFKEYKPGYFTGLQITRDPGVLVVWAGCFFLIAGSYLIFFVSHRKVWLVAEKTDTHYRIVLAGSTQKTEASFEKTFNQLFDELKQAAQ